MEGSILLLSSWDYITTETLGMWGLSPYPSFQLLVFCSSKDDLSPAKSLNCETGHVFQGQAMKKRSLLKYETDVMSLPYTIPNSATETCFLLHDTSIGKLHTSYPSHVDMRCSFTCECTGWLCLHKALQACPDERVASKSQKWIVGLLHGWKNVSYP